MQCGRCHAVRAVPRASADGMCTLCRSAWRRGRCGCTPLPLTLLAPRVASPRLASPHLPQSCGPRAFTFFLYLSDVEEGGATYFPYINVSVAPKKGSAVLWPHGLDSDPRTKDTRTHHEAQPVIQGPPHARGATGSPLTPALTPPASQEERRASQVDQRLARPADAQIALGHVARAVSGPCQPTPGVLNRARGLWVRPQARSGRPTIGSTSPISRTRWRWDVMAGRGSRSGVA